MSIVVLIGFSIYQHRLLKKLSQVEDSVTISELESIEDTPPEADVIPQQYLSENTHSTLAQTDLEKKYHTDDIEDLEAQLDATEAELDTAYRQLADEAAREEELRRKQLEIQKQYLNSPSSRNSYRSYLDTQYADIIKELNLSPEELEKFKDLLTDLQMASSEISIDIQSASSEEDKSELQKRYDALNEKRETELRDFLGYDNYEKFNRYTERSYERSLINTFTESLSSDDNLTNEQKQYLVDLMYDERQDVFSEDSFDTSSIQVLTPESTKEGIEQRIKRTEEIDARAIEKASGIMSKSQLEEFKKYLKNRRERMEMSLKLLSQ